MHKITLFIFAALFAVTLAEGQYYVPRAYYTIDAEGHESARVPLRRLRRSVPSFPYGLSGANANANAEANADGDAEANANAEAHAYNGGSANANANANAQAGGGPWDGPWGWGLGSNGGSNDFPTGKYGSANPNALSAGMTRRQLGAVQGKSISASTSVGLDSSGQGYYEQEADVH